MNPNTDLQDGLGEKEMKGTVKETQEQKDLESWGDFKGQDHPGRTSAGDWVTGEVKIMQWYDQL